MSTAPLQQNNTSYPAQLTAKLRELHARWTAMRTAGDKLANILRFYQFLVREVMCNAEYGVGADGNARGLLLFIQMGMGKTRLAVAIAMAMWDVRQPVVLLARGLQKNFSATIEEVVAALYEGNDPAELARRQAAAVARFAFVSMDAYNSADQMARVGTGATRVKKGDLAGATGGLDNRLLIVDEAHNFFRAVINSSAENANARRIYDMAMAATNLRIVFLTGTPASKDPFEMVPCFNMLAGYDLLPTQYEAFYKMYVDRAARRMKNRERLANRIVGLVSHVSHSRSTTPQQEGAAAEPKQQARDDGWFPEELPTIIERVEMGPDQYRRYLLAREKEDAEGGRGDAGFAARANARLTAPPLALPGSEKKAMSSYYVRSRSLCTFAAPRELAGKPVAELPDDAFTALTGPKLALIAERADAAPGPVLVYSQFVDASGLGPLGRFLELRGYRRYVPGQSAIPASGEKGYYAVISGEVADQKDRDAIKEAFNSLGNVRGELIKAILVSKTGAEGLDLKYIRQTAQIEPYWDRARDDQVKARAVRMGALDALPREDRVVQPYLYIATANRAVWELMPARERETQTIDEMFYERAGERYAINLDFRGLMAEACLECSLFAYGNCRTCVPTNAPLFNRDPALDLRLPDPCEVRRESEVVAASLELDGVTYHYTVDPASPLGYTFYRWRADLGGHAAIDPSDPIVFRLLALL